MFLALLLLPAVQSGEPPAPPRLVLQITVDQLGIANATPEVEALWLPSVDLKGLPFDPLEYIEHLDQLPFERELDVGLGD